MEEDDGATSGRASPPTRKEIKTESEDTKELLKVEDHSEDESEEIEDDDEEEGGDRDGDGSPQLPPLLDMIDLPLSSPLPPTPPLPSSPRDLNMEQQDSEDEGPPPGWDTPYQLNEQVEQLLTPAALSAISSDIKMEDVQQDSWNGDGDAQELVASDKKVEEHESEDEGPPPGWDSKCQPEPESQTPCPTIPQSDIKTEEVEQDAWNGLTVTNPVPSDIKMEEYESEDEGPPPGWDSKCQLEPESQTPCPTITQSDMKVEEQESEGEGPPPGWDSKFQPQPELQTTPPSSWGATTPQQQQQQSQDHHPSGAKMEYEEKNTEADIERPPQEQSISPMKPQIPVLKKPPLTTNNPEMGQMVCGSCRRLLSYPKGARFVECGCCLEENYLLQEHEVGQVICGGCDVLLMYPYGAPKVRCVNCSTETEIGDQNRRPSLSEQQRRARRHLKRVKC